MKVKEIIAKGPVPTLVGVISVKGESKPMARGGQRCDAMLKDDSGEIKFTLWHDDCNLYNVGDNIVLTNGWCGEWEGTLSVGSGKFGKIEKVEQVKKDGKKKV